LSGGAALSMRAVTGKPIKLIGLGEKLDALDTVIHLATADGPVLTLQNLPYAIPVSENA